MAFTYSGDPSASSRDAVRFLLGDTVEAQAVFSDEEIAWALTQNANVYFAAAVIADSAVAQFSGGNESDVKTKTVGALSISYGSKEKAEEYRALGRSLRVRGAINSEIRPYSGGISVSDKKLEEQDTDWDKPAFARGMHDYPGVDLKPLEMATTST